MMFSGSYTWIKLMLDKCMPITVFYIFYKQYIVTVKLKAISSSIVKAI